MIRIRDFQSSDAPSLWNVFYSAIHQIACADYTAEQLEAWATSQTPDLAKWAVRMEGIKPFVAEIDGQIVGYADLQPSGYIDHFFVSALAARKGVGSALMRHIHERAEQWRLSRLFSDVSLTARPFFERFGFAVGSAQQVDMRGVVLDNFKMTKELACEGP